MEIFELFDKVVNEIPDNSDYVNERNYINELRYKYNWIFWPQYMYPYHWADQKFNQLYNINNGCCINNKKFIYQTDNGDSYISFYNKRIYVDSEDTDTEIILNFDFHRNSPHNYEHYLYLLRDKIKDDRLNIIIDCGSSEGAFEILIAKYYDLKNILFILIDPSIVWNTYVTKTLNEIDANYIISNSFIDANNTLDNMIQTNKANVVCIKADIEGAEVEMLNGATSILKYKPLSIIATYHNQDDTENIPNILKQYYDNVEQSDGYLLCLMNEIKYPYFRKALTIAY